MTDEPAALEATITAALRTVRFGRPLFVQARVTSTNDVARALASSGAGEGTAVLAVEQTHGRGRLGRVWMSPPGGLYLSVILRPSLHAERWPLIGLACALGTAAAAEAHTRIPVRLKWPNDLLLDGGKVGGILVEAAGGDAVCGIGVNITPPLERHAASGPEDPVASIASPREAVWLAERKPDVSVVALVPDVLLECERRYDALGADPGALLAEWRARTVTLGQRVSIAGPTPVDGIAEDIAADGALLVRTAGGLRRVVVGDVVMGDVRR